MIWGGSTELNIFFLYVNNNASCEFIKKNILSVECGVYWKLTLENMTEGWKKEN